MSQVTRFRLKIANLSLMTVNLLKSCSKKMTASTDLCGGGGTFEQNANKRSQLAVHWLSASPHADAPSKNKTHLKMRGMSKRVIWLKYATAKASNFSAQVRRIDRIRSSELIH